MSESRFIPPHQSLTRQLPPEGKPISKSGLVLAAVAVYFMSVQIYPPSSVADATASPPRGSLFESALCLKDSVSIVFSKKVDIF